MSDGRITAEFIGGAPRILVVARHPARFDGRCVLVCPAFAEEMNKSRKMLTELAHRLVAAGWAVVVPDLSGTGDSEGDFSEATWERWLADMRTTERWVEAKGWRVTSLLGIRLGCLLAAQYSTQRAGQLSGTSVFWQPVTDGARALEQFLRIRLAASLMRDNKETMAALKQQLAAGNAVDVAGYSLSAQLARELESLRLGNLVGGAAGTVHWFEVLRAADAPVPVPVTRTVDTLSQRGIPVTLRTVVGEPFWTSTEIVCVPELLDLTVQALHGAGSHA